MRAGSHLFAVLHSLTGGSSPSERLTMNVRRGLIRAWVLLSIIWLAAWAFYIWDSRLVATEDKFVAYHTDLGQGWTEPMDFVLANYLELVGIGLGPPASILAFGAAIGWEVRGFRSN